MRLCGKSSITCSVCVQFILSHLLKRSGRMSVSMAQRKSNTVLVYSIVLYLLVYQSMGKTIKMCRMKCKTQFDICINSSTFANDFTECGTKQDTCKHSCGIWEETRREKASQKCWILCRASFVQCFHAKYDTIAKVENCVHFRSKQCALRCFMLRKG